MPSKKLNALARTDPGPEFSPGRPYRLQLVWVREDSVGSDKTNEPPARILVVEDNFVIATGIEAALTEAGYEVIGVAAYAEEAVALAESQRPSLVVMDVRLAGERDGIHAAIEIFRKLGIRCLFATAHYDQHSLERASEAMPLGWLQKPYAMVSLVDAVRRALTELGHDP